ncbi:MAG: hypothetical protein ACOX8W_10400 [bacterium]
MRRKAKLSIAIGVFLLFGGISIQSFVREESYLLHNTTNKRFTSFLADNSLIDLTKEGGHVYGYNNELHIEGQIFVTYYHRISAEEITSKAKRIEKGELPDYAFISLDNAAIAYYAANPDTTAIMKKFRPSDYPVNNCAVRQILLKNAYFPLRQHLRFIEHHTIFDPRALIDNFIIPFSYPFRCLTAFLVADSPAMEKILGSYALIIVGMLVCFYGAAKLGHPSSRR